MKFTSKVEVLGTKQRKVRVFADHKSLSFANVAKMLQHGDIFRAWLTQELADVPMAAYFWETPPVSLTNFGRVFEYVLIEATTLASMEPDPLPFEREFKAAPKDVSVVRFSNLGGDAELVAPIPLTAKDHYPHLAAFLRTAPATQIDSLWQTTSAALMQSLSSSPLWLSTSGLGVAWVHIRLDSTPKYYNHIPYRQTD